MREKEFLPYLAELGIEELKPMQRRAMEEISNRRDMILLAPTGSGKTLAFVLPVLKLMRPPTGRVQCIVIAPGRELVLQIASVFRTMAKGFKVTELYGGHKAEDEKNSLSVVPDIVVATPGRLLDHAVRGNIDLTPVRILVLDEFDKSLELGFEDEMRRIVKRLKNVSHTILTSATDLDALPDFLPLTAPLRLDFRESRKERPRLRVHCVDSDANDKLESLLSLLSTLAEKDGGPERAIVFVNYRESADRVYNWLRKHCVDCARYHGGMEQRDREKAIEMFNNGSTPMLVATDLAARGLDIEQVRHIIHYHQPLTPETFTHRNGRTARANADGDVYVIVGPEEDVADCITFDDTFHTAATDTPLRSGIATLYIAAGKKEKLSKKDILGFLTKECGLTGTDVGKILTADHYSLAAVPRDRLRDVLDTAAKCKIKGKKIKFTAAEA
ncbi:MAG: DEAD/DEAH box helicase [Porphyromonadaceae bacterium]|nr:DEAD/DEAH box helicase [Porphyromonadaceae bacterium]